MITQIMTMTIKDIRVTLNTTKHRMWDMTTVHISDTTMVPEGTLTR
ncbi:hypothetical protein SAE02_71170 [Skermanella aerolata]|uniref:Uncharacterized protein n=1 Tax=Skermanella aerolata TaxID=393310 RepID=A0A512E2M1_9PROT|nr:hypothetical protein [Skermanella aerolata]KJB90800.1 hypothetical protein N826_34545 [Skermanella aerolata KACC 11604]GEO42969.1 hypothetical protein SAE02_71170 [Skermanella aerolata]